MPTTHEGTVHKPLGSVRGLREYCTVHRASIIVHKLASEEEVEDWWPGGARNPKKDLSAWIRCFANYVAFLDRDSIARKASQHAVKQQIVLDALADKPESVRLATAGRSVQVHPKSFIALVDIHARSLMLAMLTDQTEQLVAAGRPEDLEVVLRAYDEMAYHQQVIAWIVTTPGVGLPFPEGTAVPQVPAEWGEVHPADFYAVAAAHQRVNVMRLSALDMSRSGESRPDFSVFFAMLAGSSDHSTADLMRDRSLAGELAASSERARAHQEAQKAAERRAKENAPRRTAGRRG
jgi:hypothetical protein